MLILIGIQLFSIPESTCAGVSIAREQDMQNNNAFITADSDTEEKDEEEDDDDDDDDEW